MDLKNLNVKVKGWKTYIMMIATICYALGGAVSGHLDWNIAIALVLGALGLGALRNGLPKPESKVVAPTPQE